MMQTEKGQNFSAEFVPAFNLDQSDQPNFNQQSSTTIPFPTKPSNSTMQSPPSPLNSPSNFHHSTYHPTSFFRPPSAPFPYQSLYTPNPSFQPPATSTSYQSAYCPMNSSQYQPNQTNYHQPYFDQLPTTQSNHQARSSNLKLLYTIKIWTLVLIMCNRYLLEY